MNHSFLSIVPPFVAIILAFLIKDILISLFLGLYIGTLILNNFSFLDAFYQIFNNRFVEVLSKPSHIKIIIFTFFISGFIGVLRDSGGLHDLIDKIKIKIKTPKQGMFATWLSGIIIFFDGYASALLVGNSLKPLTDKLKISREKLSYIVDSTSAPIASIALSTWIGTEISLLENAYSTIDPTVSGMSLFLSSLPFRFYAIFTIFFVLFIALLDRDFGPMHKAETRARKFGKLSSDTAKQLQDEHVEFKGSSKVSWQKTGLSIFLMNIFIFFYIYISGSKAIGFEKPIKDILSASDTISSLMFGPVFGLLFFYFVNIKKLKINKTIESFMSGAKQVLIGIFILILAWGIASLCKDLNTASYIVGLVGNKIPSFLLPTLFFIIASLISFATGTSWGTMAIVIPILVPLTHTILEINGVQGYLYNNIMYASIASCLGGSCWGDHSSPISDTTLFSSMACGADLIDHVRTQTPYALTVALICIFIGFIPTALGINSFISLFLGIFVCYLTVRFIGKKNITATKKQS